MYEKYYFELNKKIQEIIKQQNSLAEEQLLLLCYFDYAKMVSGEIFNKYSLNQSVGNFALEHHQKIWNEIVSHICTNLSAEQKDIYKLIVDGTFDRATSCQINPEQIIEMLRRIK